MMKNQTLHVAYFVMVQKILTSMDYAHFAN